MRSLKYISITMISIMLLCLISKKDETMSIVAETNQIKESYPANYKKESIAKSQKELELKFIKDMNIDANNTKKEYFLLQEKNIVRKIIVSWDYFYVENDNQTISRYKKNTTMSIYDEKDFLLDSIALSDTDSIDITIEDFNRDGESDISIGTMAPNGSNAILYIWDNHQDEFIKVIYEGFNKLGYFEIRDGYLALFVRGDTPDNSYWIKLEWENNKLINKGLLKLSMNL